MAPDARGDACAAPALSWSGRTPTLAVHLAVVLATVALATAGLVALGARHLSAQHVAAYQERMRRGDVAWMSDQPPEVREVVLRAAEVGPLAAAHRALVAGLDRALWLGGSSAGVLAALGGVVLARRIARPLRALRHAAAGIAAGDLAQTVPVEGGREVQDVARSFNAMAARLRESERLRRQFLAAVAHELRTPLAVVQGTLEAMVTGAVAPTPARLAALYGQSALLQRLISDLRDLALAEAGRLTLCRRPTDLAALCADAIEVLQPWIEERAVRATLAPAEPAVVDADPDRMTQVIHNLLHNAIRFTPAGGTVRVGVERIDGVAQLVVEDTGPGIPPERLPWVFDAFSRADPVREAAGGSGLGLTVVRHLVEAHGGRVRAENRPDGGCRIVVTLPAVTGCDGDRGAGPTAG